MHMSKARRAQIRKALLPALGLMGQDEMLTIQSEDELAELHAFLKSRLSASDYARCCELLDSEEGSDEEPWQEQERADNEHAIGATNRGQGGGRDEPPPFPGRPRPGGSMDPVRHGMDAAQARRSRRVQQLRERMQRAQTASSYIERFGQDAARIKLL
jgi:hypothetical protein